jgi:hypothetical protein
MNRFGQAEDFWVDENEYRQYQNAAWYSRMKPVEFPTVLPANPDALIQPTAASPTVEPPRPAQPKPSSSTCSEPVAGPVPGDAAS